MYGPGVYPRLGRRRSVDPRVRVAEAGYIGQTLEGARRHRIRPEKREPVCVRQVRPAEHISGNVRDSNRTTITYQADVPLLGFPAQATKHEQTEYYRSQTAELRNRRSGVTRRV